MFHLIIRDPVEFSKAVKISESGKNFIKCLLTKDMHKRLGAKTGLSEVQLHPWFKDISFEDLITKKMKAPFIPE